MKIPIAYSPMQDANVSLAVGGENRSVVQRLVAALIALTSGSLAAWALFQHPFGILFPGLAVLVLVAAQSRWPHAWLVLIPSLLPIIDLASTTGAIYVTESDLLIATTIAAGYARIAWISHRPSAYLSAASLSPLVLLLLTILTVSYVVSAMRGFLPYAPFDAQL